MQSKAPPVRSEEFYPTDDFGIVERTDGRFAVDRASAQLEVGFFFVTEEHPGPAVLRFAPVTARAECITNAQLEVHIEPQDLAVQTGVYPGNPAALLAPGEDEIRSWQTLLDKRPRGTVRFKGGEGTADVTDLVRTWADGGTFPSQGRTIALDAPLLLVVQPESGTSAATFQLFTVESTAHLRPRLTISTDC